MSRKYKVRTMFALCALFLPVAVSAQQELPCDIGPRTVRGYSVISDNSICLAWPTNFYRQEVRISRRTFTNHPSAWRDWTEIYANTDPTTAKAAAQFCDNN